MYNIGEINQLKVIRKTEIGYLLDGNNEEIFLHFNDSNYKDLKQGEIVDAFLYFDNKRRLAATLKTPLITKSSPSILEVVDKNDRLGLFLNMGINLLLSHLHFTHCWQIPHCCLYHSFFSLALQ